jgi:hypothetical protein
MVLLYHGKGELKMAIKVRINRENFPTSCFNCHREIEPYKGTWVSMGECQVEFCSECVKELIRKGEINQIVAYQKKSK